jgi:lipoate-protein ligase A
LDTGVQNAFYNTALEKVLLASCAEDISPNTLHFLEFSPCVLLGYNQSVEDEINVEFCRQNSIEINRRISGGGCIYMDGGTLGWEIAAKKNTPGIPAKLDDMFCKLCGGLAQALSKFGIDAVYRAPNDIEINGRKISGTGGTELDNSMIFHGSVLVDYNSEAMLNALKIPEKKTRYRLVNNFKQRTTSMKEQLGYTPLMYEVKKNIIEAFSQTLGIEFAVGGLCPEEIKSLDEELPLFGSDEWVYKRNGSGFSRQP